MSTNKMLLPSQCLRLLYFSLIHPYLTYGNVVWGSTHQTYLNKLVVLQKKAIRIATKSRYNDHTRPLFKKLFIPNLMDMNEIANCKLIFCCLTGTTPVSLQKIFHQNMQIHNHNTRQMNDVHRSPYHSEIAHKSFVHKAPKTWLTLPHYIKSCHTLSSFSSNIKKHYIAKY